MPDFSIERESLHYINAKRPGGRPAMSNAHCSGQKTVAGVDEAGRGPWAGPVVAAAVIINDYVSVHPLINDSKKLSKQRREELFEWISSNCQIGIGICGASEIDALNILRATMLAMQKAVCNLPEVPAFILVDGNKTPFGDNSKAIVEGDAKSVSIAAASIIAKVTRDRIMMELAEECPGYGWERNAGYGTKFHQEAIGRLGITEHHRRSFAPIRKVAGLQSLVTSA